MLLNWFWFVFDSLCISCIAFLAHDEEDAEASIALGMLAAFFVLPLSFVTSSPIIWNPLYLWAISWLPQAGTPLSKFSAFTLVALVFVVYLITIFLLLPFVFQKLFHKLSLIGKNRLPDDTQKTA